MSSDSISSQEKLDQMLRDEIITEEDYLRLSKAMANKPLPQAEEIIQEPTDNRKLCKSWKHRQVSGVCGGVADYFGIEPLHVRLIFLIGCLVLTPAMVVVYLLMSFMLPWDDKEAAEEPQLQGHPWRFAFGGIFILTILPAVFSQFFLPDIMNIYMKFGAELPLITQIAISIGHAYQIYPPVGIFLSLVIVIVATLTYLVCHNTKLRFFYTNTFFVLAVCWTLFFIVGCLFPLYSLSTKI